MGRLFRIVFGNLPIKIAALVIAVFVWVYAVLDRPYVTSFTVPVVLDKVETRKVISEFETRHAEVKIEGKGRDLIGLRLRQPAFMLTVPEGRAGMKELKLNAGDLEIPANLSVRSITPEFVEVMLNEVGSNRVAVEVPTRGRLGKGLSLISARPVSKVTLIGPRDDVRLFATVNTESLDLGRVKTSDTVMMRVTPPEGEGFSTDPGSVAVVVSVEKEAARIFLGVPIEIVAPEALTVSVAPQTAQIAVAGPSSRLDELKPGDIAARVKISSLPSGNHRLAAEIVLPPEFHLVKCEPALFDITIE